MATLYVGQRVKIVRPQNHLEATNAEALVVGASGGDRWWVEWAGVVRWAYSWQLEPVLPEGHRACDEDFKRSLDELLERQGIAA